jgi:hypothetical protein
LRRRAADQLERRPRPVANLLRNPIRTSSRLSAAKRSPLGSAKLAHRQALAVFKSHHSRQCRNRGGTGRTRCSEEGSSNKGTTRQKGAPKGQKVGRRRVNHVRIRVSGGCGVSQWDLAWSGKTALTSHIGRDVGGHGCIRDVARASQRPLLTLPLLQSLNAECYSAKYAKL